MSNNSMDLLTAIKNMTALLGQVLGGAAPTTAPAAVEAPDITTDAGAPFDEQLAVVPESGPVCTVCGSGEAMVLQEDGWVCHNLHPIEGDPVPAAVQVLAAAVAPPSDEDVDAAVASTGRMDEFCKFARQKWGAGKLAARDMYRASKARSSAAVLAPKADVGYKGNIVVNVIKPADPIAETTPAEVPGLPPKVLRAEIAAAIERAKPAPVLDAPTTPGMVFESMNRNLRDIVLATKEKDPQCLDAIRFIHDKLGFDLVPCKQWVEMILLPGVVVGMPDELKAAMEDYAIKFRAGTVDRTVMAAKPVPQLNEQVQQLREAGIAKEMDAAKGLAEGQRKIDLAGDKQQMLVQAARRIARDLAKNGPITIDDVTEDMGKKYNVLPLKDGKRHSWKGSVFTKSEWVYVGDMPSRQQSAHARPVGVWALKTWLRENTLNGKDTSVSSFVMSRLYNDFKHLNPKVALAECNCYLGEEKLAVEIRDTIVKSGNKFYEMPVSWVPGAIGAMIVPPNPALAFKK